MRPGMTRITRTSRWLGALAGLALAAAVACQAPASPDPGRTTGSLGGPPGQVALTFDDGPHPAFTRQVLDILDRYGVKATFFVIGQNVAAHPELTAEILAHGHSIGNHTWSHPNLTRLSGGGVNDQFVSTNNAIAAVTGTTPSCMRPPGGNLSGPVNNAVADNNMRPALWTVDTKDWQKPPAPVILERALTVQPDGVVLMHDGGGDRTQTVAALPAIIEGLQARGYTLTRVCDMR